MLRQSGQMLQSLQQGDLNRHLRRTVGSLKQQAVHQLLSLPQLHALQQSNHRLNITAAVCGAERLLAAVSAQPPPPQLLHQLQQPDRPGPEWSQAIPSQPMQPRHRDAAPLIAGEEARRQQTHQRRWQQQQITPEQGSPQASHLVIHLDRSPQHRLHIHTPTAAGRIPGVATAQTLGRPWTGRCQHAVGHGTGPFLGLGSRLQEWRSRRGRACTDALEGGMADDPELIRLKGRALTTPNSHHPGPQILVIKAVTDEKFIESTDRLNQSAIQDPLPQTTIRSAAETAEGAIPDQQRRVQIGLGPTVGIELEQDRTAGQLQGQVVSPAEMPIPFSIHTDEAQPGIVRQLVPPQRFGAAPVKDQMFMMMRPFRHLPGGRLQMLPSVHADGDDAQRHHGCWGGEATIRSSKAAIAAQWC